LRLVASPDGADGSLTIHQNASLYVGRFDAEEQADLALRRGRRGYVHVASGELEANGVRLEAGDALKVTDADRVTLERGRGAEVLVFDLP
jgi:redox-sensitive bicupin YhaK (pirin superfamily)